MIMTPPMIRTIAIPDIGPPLQPDATQMTKTMRIHHRIIGAEDHHHHTWSVEGYHHTLRRCRSRARNLRMEEDTEARRMAHQPTELQATELPKGMVPQPMGPPQDTVLQAMELHQDMVQARRTVDMGMRIPPNRRMGMAKAKDRAVITARMERSP